MKSFLKHNRMFMLWESFVTQFTNYQPQDRIKTGRLRYVHDVISLTTNNILVLHGVRYMYRIDIIATKRFRRNFPTWDVSSAPKSG